MTSLAPDQSTGHPLTASLPIVQIIDDRARHLVDPIPAPNVLHGWMQLVITLVAIVVGDIGIRVLTSNPEPLLVFAGIAIIVAAAGIVCATFAPDVDAALRARSAAKAVGE